MQFRRARCLSSEGTIVQGAKSVLVALNMMSRARESSNHLLREARSIGLSFHWRSGSLMRASKRRSCCASLTSSQKLHQKDAVVDDGVFKLRAEYEEAAVLRFGAEAHHIFDAGPIVPAAVEDYDSPAAGRWGTYRCR